MSIAADAVSDFIAPPPPRAAANAARDDQQAPSFQEHLDDARQSEERPAPSSPAPSSPPPSSSEKPQARAPAGASADPPKESVAAPKATSANGDDAAGQDQTASLHPPVLVQFIASAPALLGANTVDAAAKQSAAEAGQAEDAAAAQLAATTAAPAPVAATPKPNVPARPQPAKSANIKDAPKETAPAKDDDKSDAAKTLTPDAAVAAPLSAPPAPRNGGDGDPPDAIGAIADPGAPTAAAPALPTAPAPPEPRAPHEASAPPSPAQPQPIAPEAPPSQRDADADAVKAAPRNGAKDLAQADALKQLAQDAAAPTPKPPMAASASPAASHAQLAAPVQQASATDAAMRTSPPAAAQVGGEIIRRFNGQDTSFQFRLDPPELGRVDVRLDVSRDHRVTAVISADSPQALSDLARGARDLQQALQSAGLDLADDGLRFDLSSNGQGGSFAQAQADQPNWRSTPSVAPNQTTTPEPIAARPLSIDNWRGARVDLVA